MFPGVENRFWAALRRRRRILYEIGEVLEENAEEFVRSRVQRGGR